MVLKMPSKLKRESAVQVREEVREMMGSRCARRVHPLQSWRWKRDRAVFEARTCIMPDSMHYKTKARFHFHAYGNGLCLIAHPL